MNFDVNFVDNLLGEFVTKFQIHLEFYLNPTKFSLSQIHVLRKIYVPI